MQMKFNERFKNQIKEKKRRLESCSKLKKRRNLKDAHLHHKWLQRRKIQRKEI